MKSTYRLGDIANISAGQGAPQKESDFSNIGKPFIRAGSLAKLVEGYSENNICELIDDDIAKKYGLRLYPKDTIVFAKSGMSTSKGYVHILSQECYIVNHLACINIYNNDSSYMKYYFIYHRPNKLIKDEAYPSISLSDIRDMKINIHDIQTQKEIVAVLDKVTSLISMRKEQLEKLDILVKSKFIEMFGDPVLNPKGWEKKKWNDVFITTTGKRNSNEMVEFGQYPFFTCAKQIYYIDNYSFDCEALLLAGNNATADYDVKYYCGKFDAYQRTYVLTLKQNNSYKYFQYLLESKLSMMKNLSIGINTKYLTLKILNSIDFIIPPLDLQNQFAEFVEQVEKNKENIKSSLNQLETLYSALMQEYFG